MILAGDIGATKTHLALFDVEAGMNIVAHEKYHSADFKSLSLIVQKFLDKQRATVQNACFGVAGPVEDGHCRATNLPWIIDAKEMSKDLQIPKILLINDLEATAFGMQCLKPSEIFTLNAGKKQAGQGALIAAGTGLGEAGLYWNGKTLKTLPSEGGHTDFAPRDEEEIELWRYLKGRFGHVSYERVVSGPGIYNLYRFLIDTRREKESPKVKELLGKDGSPHVITEAALSGSCPACVRTLNWFVSIYGSEAGNLALKFLAFRGVYVGGGIAPKIIELLKKETFLRAFCDKGRFAALLDAIPIKVILNENAALLGAAEHARLFQG